MIEASHESTPSIAKTAVLLVEDSDSDAELFHEALRSVGAGRFDVERVARVRDAEATLTRRSFEVILTDLSLPDSVGMETVEALRANAPGVPLIVLTGTDDDRLVTEALHAGAEDYIAKSRLDGRLLVRAIRYAIERHEATERIRVLNEELQTELDRRLDELVRIQEKALHNERLAVLGTLAGGVAHDLNNPLMGVINHIQFAMRKIHDEQDHAKSALESALKYSRRCAEIVKDLLSYSRQGITVHMPSCMAGHVEPAAHDALRDAHEILRASHVEVELDIPESLPAVALDESRMRQVLLNLVRNACDAMQGSSRRKLRLSAVSGASAVDLTVADTGSGMDAATLSQIFKACYTTKPSGVGSGIGLALCKSVVESAGGSIEARSVLGEGTQFALSLPIAALP